MKILLEARVGWFAAAIICVATCFSATGYASNLEVSSDKKLKIAATIFPLADIAKNIGGSQVEVVNILPPGANPHTFQLTPRQIQELKHCRLVFLVGNHLDDWAMDIPSTMGKMKMAVVDQNIDFLGGETKDPHYWLSIQNAKVIARNMAQSLSEIDPASRETYSSNLKEYLSKLGQADDEMSRLFSGLTQKKMITFHNAWSYFARDYGFEIIGNVEPAEGRDPTPRHLEHMIKKMRADNIHALFIEIQVANHAQAKSFAEDNHLKLYELDPVGGAEDRQSFVDMMLYDARVIYEAQKNG
jgi:zinc transport system substrate-binding protein